MRAYFLIAHRGFLVLTLILTGVAATAPNARAALPNLADPTWMTNGPVRAIAHFNNVIWVGGQFTELREKPPNQGGQVIAVSNLAAIDATTGAPVPGLQMPAVTGTGSIVYALTVAGGKLYIGGSFSDVGGAAHRDLAAIDAGTGALDTSFHPDIGVVWTLAADASRLYVGGGFALANGQPRNRLAAFAFDGALDPIWTPSADDRPRDMAFAPDGQSIFIVGHFKNVAGPDGIWVPRDSVARLDTQTGAVQSWVAGCPCSTSLYGIGVDVVGNRVYIGMGGSDWVAAYDLSSGTQIWRTDTNGQAQDVVVMGNRLIVAGHFTHVAPDPGLTFNCYDHPETCVPRMKLAALTLDGHLDLNWDPEMIGDYDGVWRVLVNAAQLYAVGEFTQVNGVDQEKVARFTDTTADLQPPSPPQNLTSTSVTSTHVDLAWAASTDNVGVSGYNVFRGGVKIGASITTSYSDTSVQASTTYSYYVTAFDASDNVSQPSNTLTVTTPTQPDFTLSATPVSQTVGQGSTTSYDLSVAPSGGFSGTVTFSVSGLPAGATANFNPTSVTTSGSSTMTVSTSVSTPVGSYPLDIVATSGSLVHSVRVSLVVSGSTNFSISVTPSSRTVSRGSSTIYTMTITGSGGFSGTVTLSLSGLPPKTSGSFNPTSVTGSGTSTLTVKANPRAQTGTFTLTITGTSGGLVHSTSVGLTVQ